jgi:hypothetical protein
MSVDWGLCYGYASCLDDEAIHAEADADAKPNLMPVKAEKASTLEKDTEFRCMAHKMGSEMIRSDLYTRSNKSTKVILIRALSVAKIVKEEGQINPSLNSKNNGE